MVYTTMARRRVPRNPDRHPRHAGVVFRAIAASDAPGATRDVGAPTTRNLELIYFRFAASVHKLPPRRPMLGASCDSVSAVLMDQEGRA